MVGLGHVLQAPFRSVLAGRLALLVDRGEHASGVAYRSDMLHVA